jgi:hypothetical protein
VAATTVDPGGLPWLLFPVQPRRLLIGHEAHSQVNSNGGGNHRGSRRSPLAAVLGPAKEAGKEGIKPEGESEDSSSIPASLYLPCDVKHALLTMPRGHRSSDLGGKEEAPWGIYVKEDQFWSKQKRMVEESVRGDKIKFKI